MVLEMRTSSMKRLAGIVFFGDEKLKQDLIEICKMMKSLNRLDGQGVFR